MVMNVAVCEETYRWWSSDTLQSPSYPASYTGSKRCTYFLEQWQGYVISLRFSHFNLGDSEDCQGQYIEVCVCVGGGGGVHVC